MKPLYTESELKYAKSNDKLSVECIICHAVFFKRVSLIRRILTGDIGKHNGNYCSHKCRAIDRNKHIQCECKQCGKLLNRKPSHIKRHTNMFCSHSCSASYNDTHSLRHRPRRSKLEFWIESKLNILYPTLEILYCHKEAINGELDIHIPSLKLAFELNGIFHYEPIYGPDQLLKVKTNDCRKFQACIEHGIELVIMDVSKLTYFKEHNCQKYLDIIVPIIDAKVLRLNCYTVS